MSKPRSSPRRRMSRESAATSTHWLSGIHPVREALRARRRRLDCLWVRMEESSGPAPRERAELVELARQAEVPVEEVEGRRLAQRVEADGNAQGVALRVGPLPELTLETLVAQACEPEPGGNLLALDGVEDPQNVGALARVAEAAGVRGLILTQRRAPALTPAVSRASAGAIEWLPVARVPNLSRALQELQKDGYWVVVAAPSTGEGLYQMEDKLLTGRLVVVLGSEGAGVRASVLAQADHRVEIPMRGRIQSLNVSTAGAVLLYDLVRRAEASGSEGSG